MFLSGTHLYLTCINKTKVLKLKEAFNRHFRKIMELQLLGISFAKYYCQGASK